jgi:hypothetical protein
LTFASAGSDIASGTAVGALDAPTEEADLSLSVSGAAADPQATANSKASINGVNKNPRNLNHWFVIIEPHIDFVIRLIAILLVS